MSEVEGAIGDSFSKEVTKGHAKAGKSSTRNVEPGTVLPDIESRYYKGGDDPYYVPRGKQNGKD